MRTHGVTLASVEEDAPSALRERYGWVPVIVLRYFGTYCVMATYRTHTDVVLRQHIRMRPNDAAACGRTVEGGCGSFPALRLW
jgi:hypothetical protein